VPLAYASARVAKGLEGLGERDFGKGQAVAAYGNKDFDHARPDIVPARKERGPAWRADGIASVELAHRKPLGGHALQVGRADGWVPPARPVAVAHVVSDD